MHNTTAGTPAAAEKCRSLKAWEKFTLPRVCVCVCVSIQYLECPAWAGSIETVQLGFQLLCGTTVGIGPM